MYSYTYIYAYNIYSTLNEIYFFDSYNLKLLRKFNCAIIKYYLHINNKLPLSAGVHECRYHSFKWPWVHPISHLRWVGKYKLGVMYSHTHEYMLCEYTSPECMLTPSTFHLSIKNYIAYTWNQLVSALQGTPRLLLNHWLMLKCAFISKNTSILRYDIRARDGFPNL